AKEPALDLADEGGGPLAYLGVGAGGRGPPQRRQRRRTEGGQAPGGLLALAEGPVPQLPDQLGDLAAARPALRRGSRQRQGGQHQGSGGSGLAHRRASPLTSVSTPLRGAAVNAIRLVCSPVVVQPLARPEPRPPGQRLPTCSPTPSGCSGDPAQGVGA